MERTRRIELCLLEDGGVSIEAMLIPDDPECRLTAIEETPSRVFDTLERWLEEHAGQRIAIGVRSASSPIATWTTRSASLALYWVATILGNSWNPGFQVRAETVSTVGSQPLAPVHTLPRADASANETGETAAEREEVEVA
jgi:hypothetical protein